MTGKRKNANDSNDNKTKSDTLTTIIGSDFARFIAEKEKEKERHITPSRQEGGEDEDEEEVKETVVKQINNNNNNNNKSDLQPTPYSQLAKLDEGMDRCFRANRKRARDAQTLLKRAKKLKEVKFFNRLIRDFANDKQFGFAEEAFRIIKEECNGIKPNVYSYTNLLNACVRVGELERARKVFMAMEKECEEKPNEVTCTVFIKGLCEEGLIAEALKLVEDMVRGKFERPKANVRTFSTILRNCVRYRDVKSAVKAFELMRECFDILPDAACYEYLSKTYASRLDVENAEKALNDLELQVDEKGAMLEIPASALATLAGVAATTGKYDVAKRAIEMCRDRAEKEQLKQVDNTDNNRYSNGDGQNKQHTGEIISSSVQKFFKARANDAIREIMEIEEFLSEENEHLRRAAKKRAEAFIVNGMTKDIIHVKDNSHEESEREQYWLERNKRNGDRPLAKRKLEVCSGHGDWITSRCAKETDGTEWFGIEMRENRVVLTWIKSLRLGVQNLTMLCGLAHDCMRKKIPNNVLDEIYVNFPDPPEWNGSANCLVDSAFLIESHRTLKVGGYLILVTDDPGYAMRMCRELSLVVPTMFQATAKDGKPFENSLPSDYGFSYFNALWSNGNLNDRYFMKYIK